MTDRDDRRAFLGQRADYAFPDCCVVCLGPTAERRTLVSTQVVRHLLESHTGGAVHTYEYEDVPHALHIPDVPYCESDRPFSVHQPGLESHGLRVSARRTCTNQNIRVEASIKVDRIVLEFANAEYAARFRALNELPTPAGHRQQERAAARELAAIATKAVPKLFTRGTWAKARLSLVGGKGHPRPLIKALADERADVRLLALQKLNFNLRDDDFQSALREARPTLVGLIHDESKRVRRLAVDVIKRLGVDPDALAVFLDAMDDEDQYVRLTVVYGLGECGDPRAVESLIVMLDDDDELVREAVVATLGGRAVAPDVIAPSLDDESERVRAAARRALDRLAAVH